MTRLLAELPASGLVDRFASIHPSGGQFPAPTIRDDTVVVDHEDPSVSTHRNDRDRRPVMVQNGMVLHHRPVGQADRPERDIDPELARMENALAQHLPGPGLVGRLHPGLLSHRSGPCVYRRNSTSKLTPSIMAATDRINMSRSS